MPICIATDIYIRSAGYHVYPIDYYSTLSFYLYGYSGFTGDYVTRDTVQIKDDICNLMVLYKGDRYRVLQYIRVLVSSDEEHHEYIDILSNFPICISERMKDI